MIKSLFLGLVLFSTLSVSAPNPKEISYTIEGVYAVELKCHAQEVSKALCKKIEGKSNLVVAGSAGYSGITVTVVDPKIRYPRYVFTVTQLTQNGETLEGNSRPPSPGDDFPAAEFHLDIDSSKGTVSGFIRDGRFIYDLRIVGTQTSSLYPVYHKTEGLGPLELSEVFGTYRGISNGEAGFITIRRGLTPGSHPITAVWSHQASTATIAFDHVIYNEKTRILELLSDSGIHGSFLRWTLALHIDANQVKTLTGMGLSPIFGSSYEIKFTQATY